LTGVPADASLSELVSAVERREPTADPLKRLAAAVDVAERLRSRADALADHFVGVARAAGCNWTEIGGVLGVSKQAAQQRFAIEPAREEAGWPQGYDAAVREALATAVDEARRMGHHYITPDHVLVGLLEQTEEMAARVLTDLGVSLEDIRTAVAEQIGAAPPRPSGSLGMAPQTKHILELGRTLARRLGHRCGRTEHLLLALVAPAIDADVARLLADRGANAAAVRDRLAATLEVQAPELAARLRPRRRRRLRR
jgi:hypothetical protein